MSELAYSVGDILSIPGKGVCQVLSVQLLQPTPDAEPYYWCKLKFTSTRRGTVPSRSEIVRYRAIQGGHTKLDVAPKATVQWCLTKNALNRELLENKKDMFFIGG